MAFSCCVLYWRVAVLLGCSGQRVHWHLTPQVHSLALLGGAETFGASGSGVSGIVSRCLQPWVGAGLASSLTCWEEQQLGF